MQSITHKNFKGTNLIKDLKNVSPYSRNVDTENGNIVKCKGIASLFTSLGANGVHSLHTANFGTFETLLVGYGTSAYKLSGAEQSIAKTLTADFSGMHTDTVASSDKVILSGTGLVSPELVPPTGSDTTLYDAPVQAGQTFTTPSNMYLIESFDIYYYFHDQYNTELRVYTDFTKNTLLGEAVHYGGGSGGWFSYVFDTPVEVTPDTQYYFEVTLGQTDDYAEIVVYEDNPYSGGQAYKDGVAQSGHDIRFKVTGGNQYVYDDTEGTFISSVIDLGQTPTANTLTFNTTTTDDSSVTMYVRGSNDGALFSAWEPKTNSSSIPLKRYIQIKAVLSVTGGYITPSLNDFTITYTNTFDDKTSFDTGLSGNVIRFQNYGDKVYYVDGVNSKYYDNTNVKTLGVEAPSTTCTAAEGATGDLTGAYYYKITFVDSDGVESNPSTNSVSLTVASKKINLTNIPTGTDMNRKIYRTIAGGSVYYYVDIIENDTTTTYTDNTADTDIEVSSGLLRADNNPPPASTIIYEYKGYMFYVSATYPSRLYFSKVYGTDADYPQAAFEQVPETNWKEHPGSILGIRSYENKLIVTGNNFTKFWAGTIWGTANDNTAGYLIDNIGGIRHEAMTICQSKEGALCAMVTETGVRTFYPAVFEEGLQRIPLSYDIQPYFDNGVLDNAWCQFYNSRLFVGFTYYEGTPVAYNNVIAVYDFKRKVWDGLWEFNINKATVYNNKLYGAGASIGKVYEMLSGYSNDGADIRMIHGLKGDFNKYTATIQRLKIQGQTTSEMDDLEIKMQVDGATKTMPTGGNATWRQSATSFGEQDLMEKKLWVHKRGSFYGIRAEEESSNAVELDKIIIEFNGVTT